MDDRNYLALNLRWSLAQNDLTSAELSRRTSIAQPVIHRLVTGVIENPQIHTLIPLAEYFNCSLDKILKQNLSDQKKKSLPAMNTLCHQMRNHIGVINSLLKALEKILPTLMQSYQLLPKELRPEEISEKALELLPNILKHAAEVLIAQKESINHLKTHEEYI